MTEETRKAWLQVALCVEHDTLFYASARVPGINARALERCAQELGLDAEVWAADALGTFTGFIEAKAKIHEAFARQIEAIYQEINEAERRGGGLRRMAASRPRPAVPGDFGLQTTVLDYLEAFRFGAEMTPWGGR